MKANILLEGDIGTGKTTALRTLLPRWYNDIGAEYVGAGLNTFVIALDAGMPASLGSNMCPVGGIHHHYIAQRPLDGDAAEAWTRLMNSMTTEQLSKLNDPKRSEYRQFMQLYTLTNDFVCQGCNEHFGSIYKMGEDCAIVLDGLSGLTAIAKSNHVGARPIISNPEIYTIQSSIEMFLDLWWGSTQCTAVLVAHLEREINPMTGLSYLAMRTLGNKLAPKIEIKPDDVIVATCDGDKFLWNTAEKGMNLKSRHLPLSANLTPDFAQIFRSAS